MTDTDGGSPWPSNRTGLTALAVLTGILAFLVVLPYLGYVLLAVVLAYIFTPAQRRLEQYVGATTAALVLLLIVILVVLLPILYLLTLAVREGFRLAEAVEQGDIGWETIESQIDDAGATVDLVEVYETYQEPIASAVQGLLTGMIEFLGGLPNMLIGLTVTLFVLFSLLRDGERLLTWVRSVAPVRDEVQREFLEGLDRLMWASVVGNVAVAAIQAILLGIGLVIVDVSSVVFLTVVTFVFALLPLIGAFGVWLPLSVYLFALGQPVAAAFIFVYGSLVSASDMYLRPALIGKSEAFNAATVVVGIFGGIVVFGAVGLFVGPVVLGAAKIALDLFARERDRERMSVP